MLTVSDHVEPRAEKRTMELDRQSASQKGRRASHGSRGERILLPVAADHGGDAGCRGRRQKRVPGALRIEVRVDVAEPGRHHLYTHAATRCCEGLAPGHCGVAQEA
jgi:hypothetical protein